VRARDGHERETNSSPNQDHGLTDARRLASTHHFIVDRRGITRAAGQGIGLKRSETKFHHARQIGNAAVRGTKMKDVEMENLLADIAKKHGTSIATVRTEARTKYSATFADRYDLTWPQARKLMRYVTE
jgi:hypothetical protein